MLGIVKSEQRGRLFDLFEVVLISVLSLCTYFSLSSIFPGSPYRPPHPSRHVLCFRFCSPFFFLYYSTNSSSFLCLDFLFPLSVSIFFPPLLNSATSVAAAVAKPQILQRTLGQFCLLKSVLQFLSKISDPVTGSDFDLNREVLVTNFKTFYAFCLCPFIEIRGQGVNWRETPVTGRTWRQWKMVD